MIISLGEFINQLILNSTLFITVLLTMGVILINGWTDAPNSIATCVSTRSLSIRSAILLATVFNFLGVFVMTAVNSSVVQTIYKMVDFRGDTKASLAALCAAMLAIIIWAIIAAKFGIPTSEGHALIAGLSGAAIALQNGFSGINGNEWIKVVYGLLLSAFLGFSGGFVIDRIVERLFKNIDRRKATPFFMKAQIFASAAMAFMHGAQDGQKCMAVLIIGIFLVQGETTTPEFIIPVWLILFCSLVMAAGTAIGARRMIKKVGLEMMKLEPYQGFSADSAAAASLLASSAFGFPVSTTHTKTTAIVGVGVARRISYVKWGVVQEMVLAWILTFPGCGLVGYLMTFFFLKILN
ncbi:MAG: anion permease [Negativicutes bacterium]